MTNRQQTAQRIMDYVKANEGCLVEDALDSLCITLNQNRHCRHLVTGIKTVRVADRKCAWYLEDTVIHKPTRLEYAKARYWEVDKPKAIAERQGQPAPPKPISPAKVHKAKPYLGPILTNWLPVKAWEMAA